jgi:site-specific recombinase XerD
MAPKKKNLPTKTYSVLEYLAVKKAAGKTARTIHEYAGQIRRFAEFLGVICEELHNHLTGENLTAYKAHLEKKGVSPVAIQTTISILGQLYKFNGVTFDRGDAEILKGTVKKPTNYKPMSQDLLQRMTAKASPQMRAALCLMISTGLRASEVTGLTLADIGTLDEFAHGGFKTDKNGSVIRIRDEIAKGHKGGKAFLTTEARAALTQWLAVRDEHIAVYKVKSAGFTARMRGEGYAMKDYNPGQSLFCMAYRSLHESFTRLYKACDGEKLPAHHGDKYLISPHSTRRYFRTQAGRPGSIGVDIGEAIMRHRGYLTESYRSYTDIDLQAEFHKAERFFTIRTMTDSEQSKILNSQASEVEMLKEQMAKMEKQFAGMMAELKKNQE